MICPGCFQPAAALYPTPKGDRCRSCKEEIPFSEPVERISPLRGEPRAGRNKVLLMVEALVQKDIAKIKRSDPQLKKAINRGSYLAYEKVVRYLQDHHVIFKKLK